MDSRLWGLIQTGVESGGAVWYGTPRLISREFDGGESIPTGSLI